MIKKVLDYCNSWWVSLIALHKEIDLSKSAVIRYTLFSAGYSLIVVLFTFLIGFLPVEFENKYYDKIQSSLCIDSNSNLFYGKYQAVLDKMVFVNIDKESFDFKNQRIDRKKLAIFIDSLKNYKAHINCIYLDYQIPLPISSDDSLLIGNLGKLADKIVAPYILESKKKDVYKIIGNKITKQDVNPIGIPAMQGISKGYYFDFTVQGTDVTRYTKIITDDSHYTSIAYELYFKYMAKKPSIKKTLAETKYILRNKAKDKAVKQYDINSLMENPDYFPAVFTNDCIVVISMFNELKDTSNTYGQLVVTPVDKHFPEALIQINNFLCLLHSDFLKTSLFWVFLLNMIICLVSLPYIAIKSDLSSQQSKVLKYLNKYLITILVFEGIGILLFISANMKLSLGVTIFIFPHLGYLYKKIINS